MAICHVLLEIEYKDELDPNLLIPRFEPGENCKSLEVVEIAIPRVDYNVPFIGY